MKGFKFQPVVWLTMVAVVLAALVEVDKEFHILPGSWGHYLAAGIALLALILTGVKAHGAATPTADPKTTIDGETVPLTVAPQDVPAEARSPVPDPQR